MERVALYARVSSERQAEKDLSIPAQLKLMREWAVKNGHTVVGEYCDKAQSGRTDRRTQFQQMVADAKRKPAPFDIIACWKSSRFARNREDAVVYKALLRRLGIGVISVSEPFDDSPAGKLLEGVIEVIDDFYSRQLSQEVVRGMREAVRQGRWPGARPPYGYRLRPVEENGRAYNTLAVDSESASEVIRIFDLAIQGLGIRDIAQEMRRATGSPWNPGRVHDLLSNPTYAGALVWNRRDPGNHTTRPQDQWLVVLNHHPPIVSRAEFEQVQQFLHSRRPQVANPRMVGSKRLLSGLIWCYCSRQFGVVTGRGNGGRYHYYQCNARNKQRSCDAPRLNGHRTEAAILDALCGQVFTKANLHAMLTIANEELNEMLAGAKQEREQLESRLARAEKRRKKWLDLLESDDPHLNLATIGERLHDATAEAADVRSEIAALDDRVRDARPIEIAGAALQRYISDTSQLIRRAPHERLRPWLRQVVDRIEVGRSGDLVLYSRLPLDGLSLLSRLGGP